MIGKKINQLATELAPVSTDLTIIGDPDSGVSKKITLAQLGAIFSGAVSFYTNLASFPVTGDINVIYCAKDTQKLYLWSGSAYVEVFPSQALLDTYQLRSEKGVSNGYASLDSAGKVPISQLPSSIMEYKGTWNASTNTPTLANGTGDTGDVYICNVAGTVNFGAGAITFAVGDYVIYSGTIWQRSSGAVGTVTSVAASITGDAIGITGSPITTSGTLALAFAGTSAQYINGAGNLTTFPTSLISGSGASGQVTFFNGANSVTGTNNFFWDATNNRLGIGTTTPQRSIEIYNTTADNHLRLSGNAPSVSMGEAVTGSVYQAKFGLVTTNGQFVSAGVAGDFVIISQTGATIIGTSSTEKMRVNTSGNVSINNTNNTYKLDVTGTGRYTGQLRLESTITDGTNTYTLPSATGTLALTSQIPSVTGYVPYTGATANVDLGTHTLIAAKGTFSSSGSSDTVSITHSSGSGIALNITKGGNGEGLYINKTSGSGNAATIIGTLNATTLVKSGGTSSQFLKADGSVDSTSYGTGSVTSVGLSSATSGVTIGSTPITTSGTITLAIATASGSQQGLLSSTDWTTFNNKQNALTNPVTGTGTTNYLPKFTGTSTIGNSSISDNGTGRVSIGTTSFNDSFVISNSGAAGWEFSNTGSVITYNRSTAAYIPMTFEASNYILNRGNLGLGVSPSASTIQHLEFGSNAIITSANSSYLLGNAVFNSGWKYVTSSVQATQYQQTNGSHIWYNAPSGTAGNAISFTQAMTLNASGNLSIGNTNDTYKLDVSGTGRFSGNVLISKSNDATVEVNSTTAASYSAFFHSESGVAKAYWEYVNSNFSIASRRNYLEAFNSVGGFGVYTAGAKALDITTSGAATFSSSVQSNTNFISNITTDTPSVGTTAANNGTYNYTGFSGYWGIRTTTTGFNFALDTYNGGTPKNVLTITQAGAATFSSSVTATELYLSTSNGVVGNINSSNANGGYITWQTSGTTIADIGTAQQIFGSGGNDTFGINGRGARAIAFGTNNTERMRITSGGRVGIGQTAPGIALSVAGQSEAWQFGVTTASGTAGALIGSPSANVLAFGDWGGTERMRITSGGAINIKDGTLTGGGGFEFTSEAFFGARFQSNAYKFMAGNNSTEYMRLTSTGLGIGTTSPGTKLQVVGTIAAQINADGSDATGIRIYGSGTNKRVDFVAADGSTNERISGIGTGGLGTMTFAVNNDVAVLTERMRITSGGNVGIGTTAPTSKLHVVGLPTSSSGLTAGAIWIDGTTLKIVT
jgi:hypothetical protein